MQKVRVKVKLLHEDAKMPVYKTGEAAAMDIYSIEDKVIEPGKYEIIGTGLSMEIEPGYCWQFWTRSGHGAKGVQHFAGLLDSDYRGEFKVILFNSTPEPFKIEKGDRIIQVVPVPIARADLELVDELSESERGEGRFHSTGMK